MLSVPIEEREQKEQSSPHENAKCLAKFRASLKPVFDEMEKSGKPIEYFKAKELIYQLSTFACWDELEPVRSGYLAELEETDHSPASLKQFVKQLENEIIAAGEIERNRLKTRPILAREEDSLVDSDLSVNSGDPQPHSPCSPLAGSSVLVPMTLFSSDIWKLSPPTPTGEAATQGITTQQDAEPLAIIHPCSPSLSKSSQPN